MKNIMSFTLLLLLGAMCSPSELVVPSESNTADSSLDEELITKPENTTDDSPLSEELVPSQSGTDDSSFSGDSRSLTCTAGWDQFGERCFKFISTSRTWAEAERFCLLLGGNLASVHSATEYHFIQGLIVTQTHGAPLTWLGGSDAQQNGIWLWSDGSRFSFLLWAPGEPNNYNKNEACVNMNHGGGLLWNDGVCSLEFPSVCAKRLF